MHHTDAGVFRVADLAAMMVPFNRLRRSDRFPLDGFSLRNDQPDGGFCFAILPHHFHFSFSSPPRGYRADKVTSSSELRRELRVN